MKNRIGLLAIILLCLLSITAIKQSVSAQEGTSDILVTMSPCGTTVPEQPIPDDGSWLQICLSDPMAPLDTTVTTVHVKYLIEHPNPDQLEVRLSRADAGVELILWEQGTAALSTEFGLARDLETFNGTPSQGNWYLWIKDVEPGQSGWLKGTSLVVNYMPLGPLPEQLSGTPGKPNSIYLPDGLTPSKTPDRDPEKEESQDDAPLSSNGWQLVMQENFEGTFPNEGWWLYDYYPEDGREYLWDDDGYRPHYGSRAAWPANGGENGYPPGTNPYYPPYMYSWMIYGPVDLSDATIVEVDFWLWRETEISYDQICFYYTYPGAPWDGLCWDGVADWEEIQLDLSFLAGESSVWVAWVFGSDGSVQYEGTWVDDILIRKYAPGWVSAQGTLSYYDRNNTLTHGRNTKVYLYDKDSDEQDDRLGVTIANEFGDFTFASIFNWDADENLFPIDPCLDLYAVYEAYDPTIHQWVTNFNVQPYRWESDVRYNVSDGTSADLSLIIPIDEVTRPAMWIYEDLLRAYEYMINQGIDPGGVTAFWEPGVNVLLPCLGSCFFGDPGYHYVFIANNSVNSEDSVVHEVGHNYLWNKTNWWLHWDAGCWWHDVFSEESQRCAWYEGWADFLPLAVNGDRYYNSFDLEAATWGDNRPEGDNVEGRVAGALYDLFDYTNDGFDSDQFDIVPLTNIIFQEPLEQSFSEFWESWKAAGHSQHNAVRTFYQNTIDYDTLPRFYRPLPDRTVLQGVGWNHAIDLWSYSIDEESESWELDWQIVYTSDPRCGVIIDENDYVNIHPQDGWLGYCDVTIQVSDSLKTADDTFRVTVVPVRSRVYLPMIYK